MAGSGDMFRVGIVIVMVMVVMVVMVVMRVDSRAGRRPLRIRKERRSARAFPCAPGSDVPGHHCQVQPTSTTSSDATRVTRAKARSRTASRDKKPLHCATQVFVSATPECLHTLPHMSNAYWDRYNEECRRGGLEGDKDAAQDALVTAGRQSHTRAEPTTCPDSSPSALRCRDTQSCLSRV